jgi:hypothetical protein
VSCGPLWASSIKKSLGGLPTQLGSPVPNARVHVPKAVGVRATMGLQDMQAGDVVKTCKMCGYVATVQRQRYSGARRLQQHNATLLTVRSIAG